MTHRTRAALLLACMAIGVAAPDASSGPRPARIDAGAHKQTWRQVRLDSAIWRSQGRAFKAELARKLVDPTTPAGRRRIKKLERRIVKANVRTTRLSARRTFLRAKGAAELVERNARRAAYAEELTTRSTRRLLVEQWLARHVFSYFTPDTPLLGGLLGLMNGARLFTEDPAMGHVITGLTVASVALFLYTQLVPDRDGNVGQPGDRDILHQRQIAAPFHAAELIRRGIVTPQNELAVASHEAGLAGEQAAVERGDLNI
jgi:hypothetical protein